MVKMQLTPKVKKNYKFLDRGASEIVKLWSFLRKKWSVLYMSN